MLTPHETTTLDIISERLAQMDERTERIEDCIIGTKSSVGMIVRVDRLEQFAEQQRFVYRVALTAVIGQVVCMLFGGMAMLGAVVWVAKHALNQ